MDNFHIQNIKARQIYDSRGNPTIETEVHMEFGIFRAAVPSGASTGKYEALQLRDGNSEDHLGKSVSKAINNVNTVICDALKGWDCTQQQKIDKYMVEQLDGSQNEYGWCKSKLGANAILSVSLAVARAGAAAKKVPLYEYIRQISGNQNQKYILPCPAFNVINGGKHGGNPIAMQEFMVFPTGASSFKEAMKIGSEIYQHLLKIIKSKYGIGAINVGDEGGFAPNIPDHFQALKLISEAIQVAGHKQKVQIGMDCATSEFYDEKKEQYNLKFKSQEGEYVSKQGLNEIYKEIAKRYPIVSIEDPFDQDDWEGWKAITSDLGAKVQIVGDDLLVTNRQRIQKAIEEKCCNALLLKVNQIGSLTEAIEATKLSQMNNWGIMVSHRSGETEDTFIADLVVGLGVGQIKSGAPCRSQRLAKYNQLLRIEEELGEKCKFGGRDFRKEK